MDRKSPRHQASMKGKPLTEGAAAGLPPPSQGLYLDHIAIGRGTQNYTCSDSLAATIPKAAGAVASLFNITCLAGPYASLMNVMPGIALKFSTPNPAAVMSPANMFLSGHHFFTNGTTPFFDLNTPTHNWGRVGCAKLNATDAAKKETDVPNLKLAGKTRDGCSIAEVYRLNTAGGQPPKTCEGMPAAFEVQYAAEYWFYSSPAGASYSG